MTYFFMKLEAYIGKRLQKDVLTKPKIILHTDKKLFEPSVFFSVLILFLLLL